MELITIHLTYITILQGCNSTMSLLKVSIAERVRVYTYYNEYGGNNNYYSLGSRKYKIVSSYAVLNVYRENGKTKKGFSTKLLQSDHFSDSPPYFIKAEYGSR